MKVINLQEYKKSKEPKIAWEEDFSERVTKLKESIERINEWTRQMRLSKKD